jgi:hypothetical protein
MQDHTIPTTNNRFKMYLLSLIPFIATLALANSVPYNLDPSSTGCGTIQPEDTTGAAVSLVGNNQCKKIDKNTALGDFVAASIFVRQGCICETFDNDHCDGGFNSIIPAYTEASHLSLKSVTTWSVICSKIK